VVNFNQLKSLNGACNKDQGWTAVERELTVVLCRSSTQAGSDAEVIVLEDDVFPEVFVEAPSVQHPPKVEDPVKRSQKERRSLF